MIVPVMAHDYNSTDIEFILDRVMLQGRDSDDDQKMGSKKPSNRNIKSGARTSQAGTNAHAENVEGGSKQYMSTTSSTKDLSNQLANDFKPGDFDVVCSRGKWAMNSPGNIRYRNIIKDNLKRYSGTASKQEKSAIVSEIVESIKELSPEGGFVRCVNGTWWTVTDHIAREKTGQSFRDMLHHQYQSSTKAKRRRQKEKDIEQSHAVIPVAEERRENQILMKPRPGDRPPQGCRGSRPLQGSDGDQSPPKQTRNEALQERACGVVSVGVLTDTALSSNGAATSQVFSTGSNHYNIVGPSQGPQESLLPPIQQTSMPIQLAFPASNVAMAQQQHFLQQQHYLHQQFMNDLNHNHTHHMLPMHGNFPLTADSLSFQLPPTHEQRIDLEPIPIEEPFPAHAQQLDRAARMHHFASPLIEQDPHMQLPEGLGHQQLSMQSHYHSHQPPPHHVQLAMYQQHLQPRLLESSLSIHGGSMSQPMPMDMAHPGMERGMEGAGYGEYQHMNACKGEMNENNHQDEGGPMG